MSCAASAVSGSGIPSARSPPSSSNVLPAALARLIVGSPRPSSRLASSPKLVNVRPAVPLRVDFSSPPPSPSSIGTSPVPAFWFASSSNSWFTFSNETCPRGRPAVRYGWAGTKGRRHGRPGKREEALGQATHLVDLEAVHPLVVHGLPPNIVNEILVVAGLKPC